MSADMVEMEGLLDGTPYMRLPIGLDSPAGPPISPNQLVLAPHDTDQGPDMTFLTF